MIEVDVERGRYGHAADRGDRRQGDARGFGQFTVEDLALDFQADQEEEHGHQAVVDPQQQRFFDRQSPDPDTERRFQQGVVEELERAVLGHHGQHRGHDDQQSAGGFFLQEFPDGGYRHGFPRRLPCGRFSSHEYNNWT